MTTPKREIAPPPTQVHYDASSIFVLRYKKGMAQVQTGFLLARNLARAEAVGKTYCNSLPGCRYIAVTRAILADESILSAESAA